jgi:WD40 repeat protein/3',5'-cyclic AMP phosphodiesterase CpdA
MPHFDLLHITDLHFDGKPGQKRVLDAFLKEIGQQIADGSISPSLVLFSGDVVLEGDSLQQFNGAWNNFLARLLEVLKLGKEQILFTPGNHDINKNSVENLENDIAKQVSRETKFGGLGVSSQQYLTNKLKNYSKFLTKNQLNSPSLHTSLACSAHRITIGESTVGIVGINSALLASGEGAELDRGKLFVFEAEIEDAVGKISNCDYKIAQIHHPTDWLHVKQRTSVPRLLHRSFDAVFHGHVHESIFEQRSTTGSEAVSCVDISTGALYENSRTYIDYTVARFEGSSIYVSPTDYSHKRGAFRSHKTDWQKYIIRNDLDVDKNSASDFRGKPKKFPSEKLTTALREVQTYTSASLWDQLHNTEVHKKNGLAAACITKLIQLNKDALEAKELKGFDLSGANFSGANLTKTRFIDCNLSDSFFANANLDKALLRGVNLKDAQFVNMDCIRSVQYAGSRLALSGPGGVILMLNKDMLMNQVMRSTLDGTVALRWTKNGKMLSSAHEDGSVFIWTPDASDLPLAELVVTPEKLPIHCLAWSGDTDPKLTTGGQDGVVSVYTVGSAPHRVATSDLGSAVLSVDIYPSDSGQILAGLLNGNIAILNQFCQPTFPPFRAHSEYVRCVRWRPSDDTMFASCGDDGYVSCWRCGNSTPIYSIEAKSEVLALAWNPSLPLLACGLRNDLLLLWNPEANWSVFLHEHGGRIWDLCWDESGSNLVTASNEGKIVVWNNLGDLAAGQTNDEAAYKACIAPMKMSFTCKDLVLENVIYGSPNGYKVARHKDFEKLDIDGSLSQWLINLGAKNAPG